MTREEEIQKAWDKYRMNLHGSYPLPSEEFIAGFNAGAEWADAHPVKKQAIWYDTKEKPITGSEIVVICSYKGKKKLLHTVAEPYMFPLLTEKWAYLDDLINL